MMFLERWLVYPAPPADAGDWNPTWLGPRGRLVPIGRRHKLHGWFVPHANPKRAILYCHGNGEHIAFNAELAAQLRDRSRPRFSSSTTAAMAAARGGPSEAGCIADGRAAQHWLAERMGIKPSEVVLMGRSLGGAVAVALASEEGAQALVLENAFSTMPDVAAIHYPWLPVRWVMDNRYDSLSRIKKYHGPLIQSHGTDDHTRSHRAWPADCSTRAPSADKKWIEFPVCGHNSRGRRLLRRFGGVSGSRPSQSACNASK